MEQSLEELRKYCSELEKTLVLVNQGFEKNKLNSERPKNNTEKQVSILKLEDIQSDDDSDARSMLFLCIANIFL